MIKPRRLANELLTRHRLKQPTLEDVVFLVEDYGYELIDFDPDSSDAEKLFQELSLDKTVYLQDAFLYTNHDVKLLFLKDSLDADEKRLAATHELGHIVCGHATTNPSVAEEYEANEFVHYFLNPPQRTIFWNVLMRHKWRSVAIFMALAIAIAGSIVAINSALDHKYSRYYVTTSGKKYHKQDCSQINGKTNIRKLTIEELSSGKYEPCGTCLRDLEQSSETP